MSATRILAAVGLLSTLSFSFRLYNFIRLYTRPSSLDRYKHAPNSTRPWALITGSSDGIGRAFAHELASEGFNLVLHGRSSSKLSALKETLRKTYPSTECRNLIMDVCDTSKYTDENFRELASELEDIHLTVLINNVGGGHPPHMKPKHKTFEKYTGADIDGTFDLNARFATHLTSALLPLLLKHNSPSLIMNIGSGADSGAPWLSIYSGSKAFLTSWTTALSREMKIEKRDVEVICCVAFKVTGVSFRVDGEGKETKAEWMMPHAETWVKAALGKVGCGETVLPAYWVHGFMRGVMGCLPSSWIEAFLEMEMREERKRDELLEENKKVN